MEKKRFITCILLASIYCFVTNVFASSDPGINHLKEAYPQYVKDVTSNYIAWHDGTRMQIGGSSSLLNWFTGKALHLDKSADVISEKDIVHSRFEPFFKNPYGAL